MRLANKDDFDLMFSIYMDETVNPYMHYAPTTKENFKPIFAEIMARHEVWIIQDNSKNCGMVTIIKGSGRADHTATIASLGILKSYQGRGLAKNCINFLIQRLREQGLKRINLGVEDDNPRALALYKKLGFQVEGYIPKGFKRENEEIYIDQTMLSIIFD